MGVYLRIESSSSPARQLHCQGGAGRHRFVTRVYVPRFSVSSQQRFGVTDMKAPSACHSSQVLDRLCYSSQVSNGLIALRQISVTALFYLEDSRKIYLSGVRARRSKEMRRAARRTGGRERAGSGFSIYMCISPWACPMEIGPARSVVCFT